MPVAGIELKEGQVWLDGMGNRRTLKSNTINSSNHYKWLGYLDSGEYNSYSDEGMYYHQDISMIDLVALIDDGELKYTESQIRKAYENWNNTTLEDFLDILRGTSDPEYLEYLRLKDKFEGK